MCDGRQRWLHDARRGLDKRRTEPVAPSPRSRAKRLVVAWGPPLFSVRPLGCFAEQERKCASGRRSTPQGTTRRRLASFRPGSANRALRHSLSAVSMTAVSGPPGPGASGSRRPTARRSAASGLGRILSDGRLAPVALRVFATFSHSLHGGYTNTAIAPARATVPAPGRPAGLGSEPGARPAVRQQTCGAGSLAVIPAGSKHRR